MRKKFNRNAICNSENYKVSRQAHLDLLKERHSHFCGLVISGEIKLDTPIFKDGEVTPKFKTIKICGNEILVTVEEYNTHCAHLGL